MAAECTVRLAGAHWMRSLQSEHVRVQVSPELGGKIVSLVSTRSNREWLWRDMRRQPVARPALGPFEDSELSGWDECFPTIAACRYPDVDDALDRRRIFLADHGDLWRTRWRDVSRSDDEIALELANEELAYVFRRTISLNGSKLDCHYSLTNCSDSELRCMWAMHPLFRLEPLMTVRVGGSPLLAREFGFDGGRGDAADDSDVSSITTKDRWPIIADGSDVRDFRTVLPDASPFVRKIVLRDIRDRTVSLLSPERTESLRIQWIGKAVRYLGICVNWNAWPVGDRTQCWIALEPSSGSSDSLYDSFLRDEYSKVRRRSTTSWTVSISLR